MDSSTHKRVSKACDACKRRKVKCNGQERCQQCSHLGLRCVYSATGKLRSQGKRGHIISEFRNQTNNLHATSPPTILPANGQHFQPYNGFTYAVDSNGFKSGMSTSPGTNWLQMSQVSADQSQLLLSLLLLHSTARLSSWTSSQIIWKVSILCSRSLPNTSYGTTSILWIMIRRCDRSSTLLVDVPST